MSVYFYDMTPEEAHDNYIKEQAYKLGYEDAKKEFDRPHGEWIKEPIYLCHYGCDGCYKNKKYADLEWCSTCEFWKAYDFNYRCSICNNKEGYQPNFCPKCGSDNRKRGKAE